MLAFAISEGAGGTGCAPSSSRWTDGVPQNCKTTLGTPEDTAPCHHHSASTWQETPASGKPGVGVSQQPCCGDSRAHSQPPPFTSPGQGPQGSPTATHPPTSTILAAPLPLAPLGVLVWGQWVQAPRDSQAGNLRQVIGPQYRTSWSQLGLDQVTCACTWLSPAHSIPRESRAGGCAGMIAPMLTQKAHF